MSRRLRVGINGFGRIGRMVFRAGYGKVDFVGINDTSDIKTNAHLLKYDSTHRKSDFEVAAGKNGLIVNGKEIPFSSTRNPAEIPWSDWEVDMVFECTGAFKKAEDFQKHMKGSVKRVLVSAPAEGVDFTAVYGVNHTQYSAPEHKVVSNASCTTNCLAPLVKVLHENFQIEKGTMTTVHSYTNDQKLLDAGHKDLRRARAAALSMIPTTTGAAVAVGEVMPDLKGKIDGVSIRVPTPNVSLVDFVAVVKKPTTEDEINFALMKASESSLKGVLYCEKDELVSSDFIGNPYSSIVDLSSTMVIDKNMIKVLSWYDNEMGFSYRMIDLALFMQSKGL
jgi:glyceraldehyde 3-phosphate dehydrogenase